MALDSQKYFNAARDRKNELSDEFGAVRDGVGKPYGLSDVVESANNFLQFFVSRDSSPEEARITRANVGFSDSISDSVIPTSTAPNEDTRSIEKKKEEERARDALLAELQKQLEEANKRISKMIDECYKMAEWCREQAKQASAAMEKIADRMTKNSQFINDIDELFESYKANGHFDKEKARRMLLERGIKTDDKISDAKLMELLRTQKNEALGEIAHDTKSYEELEKRKQKFEESAEEIERLAKELKERRDEINNDKKLSLSEQAEQLKELEGQYSPKVQVIAAELERNIKEAQELRERSQMAYEKSAGEKKGDISSLMSDFAVSALPVQKEIKQDKSDLEDPATAPEVIRQGVGIKTPSSA